MKAVQVSSGHVAKALAALALCAAVAPVRAAQPPASEGPKWYTCWANVHSDGPPFSDENLLLRLVSAIPQSTPLSELDVSSAWRDFVLEQPSSGTTRTFCRAFDASAEAGGWRDSLLLTEAEDGRVRPVAWRLAGATVASAGATADKPAVAATAETSAQAPEAAPPAEPGSTGAAPAVEAAATAAANTPKVEDRPAKAEPAVDPAALARTQKLNQEIVDRNAAIETENQRRKEQYDRELAEQREQTGKAQQAYQQELARARAAQEEYQRKLQAYQDELASGKYQPPQ